MSGLTPGEARSRLAAEFESRGWEYDLTTGRAVLQAAQAGESEPAALAERVPGTFLARNGIAKADMANAIERALGGQPVAAQERAATIVFHDHSFTVDLTGAQITGSNFNIGAGTQINVDASASKDEVLTAVAAIVAAGLIGELDADAARGLAAAIDSREDITVEDIREVTAETARAESPRQGRAKAMLTTVATSALAGTLATGLSAGLGEVIPHLPF